MFHHQIKAIIIFRFIYNFIQRRPFKTSLTAEITIAFKSSREKLRFLYNLPIILTIVWLFSPFFGRVKKMWGYSSRNRFLTQHKKINESCGKWKGAFLAVEAWRKVSSKCHSQNFVNLWLPSVDLKNLFITGFQDKSGTCRFILALFSRLFFSFCYRNVSFCVLFTV